MKDRKDTTTRRDALKLVGLGAPAVAAATVTGAGTAAAEVAAPAETTGLRKTEHVAKYLETARF